MFQITVVVDYRRTNALDFVLMHKGVRWWRALEDRAETTRELWKDVWISLAYTGLIVVLIKLGGLKPVESHFART